MGNLAHALKTPLSVLVNEAAARPADPLAQKVLEQTDIMRDQVARQLERARLAARSAVVGTLIEVPPVVTALARTMEKLYRDRNIAIALDVPAQARFRGEQQDLEEMIGNLVDNACKWAQSRVAIEVIAGEPRATARGGCASSSTTTGPGFRRSNGSKSRGGAVGSTNPSRGPGLGCRSSSSLQAYMVPFWRLVRRRSGACALNLRFQPDNACGANPAFA